MLKYFRLLGALLYLTSIYPIIAAQTQPPAKDRMVTVGKRQVYVLVESHGGPAVIPEAGFVNDLRSFGKIQPEIANLATVVSYDRAGLDEKTASRVGSIARTGEFVKQACSHTLRWVEENVPSLLRSFLAENCLGVQDLPQAIRSGVPRSRDSVETADPIKLGGAY